MSTTAYKAAILVAVIIASLAAPLVIHHSEQQKWLERNETLRLQAERLAELSAENQRLSNLVTQTESSCLSNEQLRELLRLRGEIGQLRATASETANLRVKNQQLIAARTNLEAPSSAPAPPDPQTVLAHWPKAQLAPAGYADPTSALQTVLCALSRGDPNALAASVTPEAKSKLTKEQWFVHGTPAEEIAASTKKMTDSLSPSSGFYVLGQNLTAQGQASLDVYFEGEGKTRKFELKKIGDEWKFDTLGNGAWP
jgi:hypothetical protein